MTQFEHLELLYNQFLNLSDEINTMIEKEEYDAAVTRLEYKDKLIKKILLAKKTVNFTGEEIEKASLIEQKIRKNEQETLVSLQRLQDTIGEELNNTKKKIKVSTAYTVRSDEQHGDIIDIAE